MKTMKRSISTTLAILLMAGTVAFSQSTEIAEANAKDYSVKKYAKKKDAKLKTYVIERDMPGAGELTTAQLKDVSQLSNNVIEEQGKDIKWLHSYVTSDKIFCVYKAVDESILREHAKKANFPVTSIRKLAVVISPETAMAKVN
jgi:hypothetical protein